ncbi:MAG TPA: DinB family protein [Candidatus Binatia bacterium]|nr:DinB family protein [Candidatus Binatia bacterium]
MPSTTLKPEQLRDAGRNVSAADYAGTIRAYYPFWDTQHRPFLLAAVAALPREKFDFKPRPEMFTAHQMIVHIAECERHWIHVVIEGGAYEEWVAPAEPPEQGWTNVVDLPDHASLFAALEKWHRNTQRQLERPASDLTKVITWRDPSGREFSYTLHCILDRVHEHEIHHRGQLNLYLRLMGIEPPSI